MYRLRESIFLHFEKIDWKKLGTNCLKIGIKSSFIQKFWYVLRGPNVTNTSFASDNKHAYNIKITDHGKTEPS